MANYTFVSQEGDQTRRVWGRFALSQLDKNVLNGIL